MKEFISLLNFDLLPENYHWKKKRLREKYYQVTFQSNIPVPTVPAFKIRSFQVNNLEYWGRCLSLYGCKDFSLKANFGNYVEVMHISSETLGASILPKTEPLFILFSWGFICAIKRSLAHSDLVKKRHHHFRGCSKIREAGRVCWNCTVHRSLCYFSLCSYTRAPWWPYKVNLRDLGLNSGFFNMIPQAQATKEK